MSLIIRSATVDDTTAIAELNALVQGIHADAHPDIFQLPNGQKFVEDWGSERGEGNTFTFLALLAGKPVGYAHGEIFQRTESVYHRSHEMIYVHQLCVAPEARGQGIATSLLDAAKQLGREHGIDRLALDVWRFNEPARRFFERYGLRTYNERRWMRIGAEPPAKAAD